MAKQKSKVDVEAVLKEVAGFGSKASHAIDSLLKAKTEIRAKAEERCTMIDGQINSLNELYRASTGRYYIPTAKGGEKAPAKNGRIRRSADQCASDAAKILAYLKAHPNAKAAEIKANGAEYGPSLPEFIKKYGGGTKVKSEGRKAATTYALA